MIANAAPEQRPVHVLEEPPVDPQDHAVPCSSTTIATFSRKIVW